jgi:hypothetical protein
MEKYGQKRHAPDLHQLQPALGDSRRGTGTAVDDADFAKYFPGVEYFHHQCLAVAIDSTDANMPIAGDDHIDGVGRIPLGKDRRTIAGL